VNEEEVLSLFESCSNVGRWGPDDQLGTLNLITPEKRLAALRGVRAGAVVPLGARLAVGRSQEVPPSASLSLRSDPLSVVETLCLNIHGYETTHLDALGHIFFEGRMWGGRVVAEQVADGGLGFASIEAAAAVGVVTRGVLLDVAAARGAPFLAVEDGIGVADLQAAEVRAGVRVEPGDAVFIRSGHDLRVAAEGGQHDELAAHEGVLPEVLPWLHERDAAMYAADCIEQRPAPYQRVTMPLHQVAMVAMGLWLLDCPDLEALAAACARHGRCDFAIVIAPLRVPGGTGSAVNPLALF